MRKRPIVVLAAVAALGLLALWLLRANQLELIHTIVVNALIQKAPEGYPPQKIREAFDAALLAAADQDGRGEYLEQLLELSRRLEKVQRLSQAEVEEIVGQWRAKWPSRADRRSSGAREGRLGAMLPWLREMPALSDRDRSSALSRLRAYHPAPACEVFPGELAPETEAGADPFLDFHHPVSSSRGRTPGLAVGAAQEAPEARPQPRDHPEEP